jgi:hypothetical protein
MCQEETVMLITSRRGIIISNQSVLVLVALNVVAMIAPSIDQVKIPSLLSVT